MDKLAEQLKRDADNIEVRISDELDHRIEASLRSVTPEAGTRKREPARPAGFWWASSLTGIAAAALVILVMNLQQPDPPTSVAPDEFVTAVPVVDWQAETAALTGPLQQELENLQSDLEKAEKKVRQDIGL